MNWFDQDPSSTLFYKRINSFEAGYRQNIALLADSKEEISSALDYYFNKKKSSQLIHIHFNPTYLSRKEVFRAVSFCLLSEYTATTAKLDQLITISFDLLPKTTNLIKELLPKRVNFSEIISLINEFIEESGRNCVFIFEEFLQAATLFTNFYQQLAGFAVAQRKCMLVVASSLTREAKKSLGNELNLLFGNFEKIHLNQSNFFKNFFFLKEKIKPLNPSAAFLSFFVNIIDSNKSYYPIFQEAIKKFAAGDEDETIVNVLENLILKKETYFFQKFINKIDSLNHHFKTPGLTLKLLLLLSKGYLRKSRLREITKAPSQDITHRLNKLASLNYLNKHGNIYKIKDKLFAFWLAHVFNFYSQFPVFDSPKRKQLWKKEIQEEINLYKEEFLKDRLKKILELFLAFEDDSLSINKDKYSLPRLDKAKIISYPEDNFHLLVGEGKKIIFAGIKEKTADNQDVFNFIQKGSNLKGKNIQKIFIPLDNLTDTAMLLAKDKKIPVWDRNRLNCLLGIYNKPNFL